MINSNHKQKSLLIKVFFSLVFIIAVYLLMILGNNGGFSVGKIYAEKSNKTHPDNWMDTHGAEYFSKKGECQGCHGNALDGGMTDYACNMCHLSPKHPKNWSSKHGRKYRKQRKSCGACHGKYLTGGRSKVSCKQCHVSPRHPGGWKSSHGAVYNRNPQSCGMCHQTAVKGNKKRGCNRCHLSPQHPSNWSDIHGPEYYQSKESCSTCHGHNLTGGSATTTCNSCHLSPKHPQDWTEKHGATAMKELGSCSTCHGNELTGGQSKIDCGSCHINPKHPKGWMGKHGTKYFDSKKQCGSCHTKHPFDLSSKEASSNCLSCHTGIMNTQEWQPESNTNTFNVNASHSSQVRNNTTGGREFITNNDLGVHFVEQGKDITFTSQLRYSREWLGSEHNFDLYETYFQFDSLFNNHLSIVLGRQSLISNIDYMLMDGINVNLAPSKWFDISLFTGVPRYFEEGDLTGEIGLVSGISFILNEVSYTKARLDFLYQKKNFTTNVLNNTDKMYVSASVSKGISIFRLYALGEYDITDTLPTTITLGTEIYPFVKKVGFLIEGNYFNESRNDNLENIFTIFSANYLWQIKAGVFVNSVKNLNLYQNFSFQRYDVLASNPENGFNAETGLGYDFDQINLEADVGYYFIRSYGGTLHGARVSLYEEWTKNLFSELYFDFITYTKVTNDDATGFNIVATTGVNLNKGFSFAGAFEYIRNNMFNYDLRGTLRLNYYFSHRFRDWGKRTTNKK